MNAYEFTRKITSDLKILTTQKDVARLQVLIEQFEKDVIARKVATGVSHGDTVVVAAPVAIPHVDYPERPATVAAPVLGSYTEAQAAAWENVMASLNGEMDDLMAHAPDEKAGETPVPGISYKYLTDDRLIDLTRSPEARAELKRRFEALRLELLAAHLRALGIDVAATAANYLMKIAVEMGG